MRIPPSYLRRFPYSKLLIADYGAELVWCEPSIESRKATVKTVSEERNLAVIYDNDDLIAGQGTVGLEFLEQVDTLLIRYISVIMSGECCSKFSTVFKGKYVYFEQQMLKELS